MGATGFELSRNSTGKQANPCSGGAESGAVTAFPPDLANLIGLWSKLSDSTRSAIVTLASASVQSGLSG
jgi:hypothetical protein